MGFVRGLELGRPVETTRDCIPPGVYDDVGDSRKFPQCADVIKAEATKCTLLWERTDVPPANVTGS